MTEKYKIIIPDIDFWKNLVPCQIGCPIHTDAGRYVQLIAENRNKEAYLTAFGAAGAALLRFFGGSTLSVGLLISALVIWIVFPLTLSARLLRRQDI